MADPAMLIAEFLLGPQTSYVTPPNGQLLYVHVQNGYNAMLKVTVELYPEKKEPTIFGVFRLRSGKCL
jgi:hypothetical protein